MVLFNDITAAAIVLWAVIDPIGTVPVFLAVTKGYNPQEKKKIARIASFAALGVLTFFLIAGGAVLRSTGVPLAAFQTSGGVILFLFAINMIFGSSKPEQEIELVKNEHETAIFPLAIPSIAGPGAILAVVLQSESAKGNLVTYLVIFGLLIAILFVNYLFMRLSNKINHYIGNSGAIVISKVMGLILASMAANNILMGIKIFFNIG